MVCDKFSYAEVETCLYEAMRTLIKGGKVQAEREGKALIDPTLSHHNKFYVHECLKPLETPPKKKNGKLYITTEDGKEIEYVRGLSIANFHDSQLSSNYGKAHIVGNYDQLSKAMGFIITLPKDYIETAIPDLTDEEYLYYVEKSEAEGMHKPFQKNPDLEKALSEKFKKHDWTKEEREKAQEFLLAAKDCTLEEMGIRNEDVLFWSSHFDENWPHIHGMALPTNTKTYDKDVYSKKKKKDGTYSLLHKKGDVDITYSVSKFYKEKTIDGKYKFFEELHPNIVKRMEEKKFNASGLINGATQKKSFSVQKMSREEREASVEHNQKALVLEKKYKKKEEELSFKENQIKDADTILDMNNQLIQQGDDKIKAQNEQLKKMAGSYTTLSTAIDQKKKDKQMFDELTEKAQKAYEGTYKGQEEEYAAFKAYVKNKGEYEARIKSLEAKEQRLQTQCIKLEDQKDALKGTVKDLCKEVGDVGLITRAVHNISQTEKEIQNYDDMTLFIRVATNILERKFPKVLQEIMSAIQQLRGIGSRKNIINTMQKEAEAQVASIKEEWDDWER